jgi:hypothetical protein
MGPAQRRRLVSAVLRHPGAWPGALTALLVTIRPRWWASAPRRPGPDPAWWAMRLDVAYGRPDAEPSADDVVAVVRWMGAMRRLRRR